MVGIYKITSPSNKIYIGQSTNIEHRFDYYKKLQCKGQPKLYNSLKKYSPTNHLFKIIEECDIDLLNEREIYWIDYYKCLDKGLNIKEGGKGGKHSQETKDKISKNLKNRDISSWKNKIYSEERNNKLSQSKKGLVLSSETKDKISNSNKGVSRNKGAIKSEGFRELIRKRQLGTKHSEEHIENYKKSMVGKNLKPIICITTGEKFNSTKEASIILKINSRSINNNLKGLSKMLKNNMKFKYLT